MTDVAADAVAEGRDAWARIREQGRKSFDDWLTVARALAIGRSAALQAAGTNRPVGTTFNRAASEWLRQAGLDGINPQERYRALLVLENLPAISAFRDGLDEAQRRRLNHPNACWHAWKRACGDQEKAPAQRQHVVQHVTAAAEAARRGRPVYWSQDAMRRAHHAMLDSKSSDLLTLARVALEAAIRTEADLLALLPAEAPPKPAPRQIAAPAALEVHA
jgi:hypothetical protein